MFEKSIRENIADIDWYGSKVDLQFKKNKEHPTLFGGVITMLNIIVLVFITIQYGSSLFQQNNPVTNYTEETVKQPEIFNMTEKTFSITFGMQDPNTWNHYFDESVYTITAIQSGMTKVFNQTSGQYEQQWTSVDIGPYLCNRASLQVPGTQQYYDELVGLDQMYCFDQSDDKVWIGGDFSADMYGAINFTIQQCTNKTDSEAQDLIAQGKKVIVCKSQDDIDALLSGGYFAAYYTDKVINPKNLDNPFTTISRDIFWPVSNKLGLVQEDMNYKRDVIFSYSTEQVIYGQNNQFVNFVIRFEKAKQARYYRSYIKFEDVVAQISGVMDLVISISAFICIRMSELDLSKQLVNEVFSFQSNEESEDEKQQQNKQKQNEMANKVIQKITDQLNNSRKRQQTQEMNIINNEDIQSQANSEDQNNKSFHKALSINSRKKQHSELLSNYIKGYKKSITNQNPKSEKELKEDEKYKKQISKLFKVSNSVMDLQTYEYILYYLFPCWRQISRKKRQIDKTKEQLDSHLDVLYLVNKLQEVDKLKMLLLSDEQIKLFNYLPKPTIREIDLINEELEKKKGKQAIQQNIDKQDNQSQGSCNQSITQQGKLVKHKQVEQFNLLYMDKRSDIEKASDAYSAFEMIRKQQTRSPIDNKLLFMLDPKILDYFLDDAELDSYHDLVKQDSQDQAPISAISVNMKQKILSQFGAQKKKNKLSDFNLNSQADKSPLILASQQSPQPTIFQFNEYSNNQLFMKKNPSNDSQNNQSFKLNEDDVVLQLDNENENKNKNNNELSKKNNQQNTKQENGQQQGNNLKPTSNYKSNEDEDDQISNRDIQNCKSDFQIPSEIVSPNQSQLQLPNSREMQQFCQPKVPQDKSNNNKQMSKYK